MFTVIVLPGKYKDFSTSFSLVVGLLMHHVSRTVVCCLDWILRKCQIKVLSIMKKLLISILAEIVIFSLSFFLQTLYRPFDTAPWVHSSAMGLMIFLGSSEPRFRNDNISGD